MDPTAAGYSQLLISSVLNNFPHCIVRNSHGQLQILVATSYLLQETRASTKLLIEGIAEKVLNLSIRLTVGLLPAL